MGASWVAAAAVPPPIGTPTEVVFMLAIASVSVILASVAWSLVARRDLRDPGRDIRHPWQPSWRAVRMPLEAIIVAVSTLIAVWWGRLADAFDYPADITLAQILVVTTGLACVAGFALVGLVFIRSGQGLLAVAVIGMAGWSTAGLVASVAMVKGHPPLWTIAVLLGSLPLVAAGLSTFHTQEFDSSPAAIDSAEHRDTVAATTATVAAVGVVTLALPLDRTREPEPMSTLLVVLLIVLFALRESVNAYYRIQLTHRLSYQAVHDQLTGLPNRRGLAQALDAVDPTTPWVVLVLDLDGISRVNDELGHQTGDTLLAAVGARLAAACPPPRHVARLGGDEFAVLSPGDLDDGRRLAVTLRACVLDAVQECAPSVPVTTSIGVGLLPEQPPELPDTPFDPGDSAGDQTFRSFAAVSEASAALRAAKTAGRDRIEVYAGRTEQARRRRLAVERRLRATLADDAQTREAIRVHLQPQVVLDLDAVGRPGAATIHGFEALARWTDPELGPVPPDEFIQVAEQTGMIVPLGAHLVSTTLREAAAYGLFDTGLHLSINVSALQLRAPGFADYVLALVAETGADPRTITFELTEAVLLDEDDVGLPALVRLTEAGLGLAIDDFGTGHAALAYLRRLPLDVLKIDRSLTTGALGDRRSRAVVRGMIGLAGRLGITVVMEGIEDRATADLCRQLGAQVGQGWYYGAAGSWAEAGSVDRLVALSVARAAQAREDQGLRDLTPAGSETTDPTPEAGETEHEQADDRQPVEGVR